MAQNLKVCSINDNVLKKLKAFRFRKETTNAAIIMKINMASTDIVIDDSIDEEDLQDPTLEDITDLLSPHQPRFVAYSLCLKHDDGRTSFPLCFIYFSPSGCKPEMQMMYAGSKLSLVQAGGFTKVFEVRSLEDMTEEWLVNKLKFFS